MMTQRRSLSLLVAAMASVLVNCEDIDEGDPCRIVPTRLTDDYALDEVPEDHRDRCNGRYLFECVPDADACGNPCDDCYPSLACEGRPVSVLHGHFEEVMDCGLFTSCYDASSYDHECQDVDFPDLTESDGS